MTVTIRRRGAVTVLLATTLASLAPGTEPVDAATASNMRSLINAERVEAGRRTLRSSWRLSRIARRHSVKMARQQNLHHNPRLAYQARRMSWTILGENVGVGTSVESLHRAFMRSAPHRRNVLNGRFRRAGVGSVYSGGRLWITIVFAN